MLKVFLSGGLYITASRKLAVQYCFCLENIMTKLQTLETCI